MTTVAELIPGEVVELGGQSAIYVAQCQHPLWPALQLVIWRLLDGPALHDGSPTVGRWSHDALSPAQDVGQAQQSTRPERELHLRRALTGSGALR